MALAELIIRAIDWFYIRPVAAVLPRQVFRYVVCGGVTYILFDPSAISSFTISSWRTATSTWDSWSSPRTSRR